MQFFVQSLVPLCRHYWLGLHIMFLIFNPIIIKSAYSASDFGLANLSAEQLPEHVQHLVNPSPEERPA